jgi:hypothetical protein
MSVVSVLPYQANIEQLIWQGVLYHSLRLLESEAFWSTPFTNTEIRRPELLIESLFGRTNNEIRNIKECFRDSQYLDSLEKCMEVELKANKFRIAVLLVLEETRQDEHEPVETDMVQNHVKMLREALMFQSGGKTMMISIIIRQNDSHLREILHAYEKIYKRNFAREMITKFNNLLVRLYISFIF